MFDSDELLKRDLMEIRTFVEDILIVRLGIVLVQDVRGNIWSSVLVQHIGRG